MEMVSLEDQHVDADGSSRGFLGRLVASALGSDAEVARPRPTDLSRAEDLSEAAAGEIPPVTLARPLGDGRCLLSALEDERPQHLLTGDALLLALRSGPSDIVRDDRHRIRGRWFAVATDDRLRFVVASDSDGFSVAYDEVEAVDVVERAREVAFVVETADRRFDLRGSPEDLDRWHDCATFVHRLAE